MRLSTKQEQIVNHIDGAILVKAGPGSGKTRVLIERIKYLLTQRKRCNVLALTFSNLAADEMKERLEEDASVVDKVDRVKIGTIHSFCLDLVQRRSTLIGLNPNMVLFENDSDRLAILKSVFTDNPVLHTLLKENGEPQKFLSGILAHIADHKKKFILPEESMEAEPFPSIYSEYNQRMLAQNAMDFDDILFLAYKILTENKNVVQLFTSLYKYICIDESQDLNYAQYQVIKALCGTEFKNIMMVGDANQSIYGFNGSNSKYMTEDFVEDFEPTVYLLDENFRSAKSIVRFANTLEKSDSTSNYVYEGELLARMYEDEEFEARDIVEHIQKLMVEGHPDVENKLTYNDFAIIARNRYVFSNIKDVLSEKNIPFYEKQTNAGIGAESEFMKVFELSLRLLVNSKDIVHREQLCKTVKKQISVSDDDTIKFLGELFSDTPFASMLTSLVIIKDDESKFLKAIGILKKKIESYENEDEKYLILNDIGQWERHWKRYARMVESESESIVSFRNCISLGKTQEHDGENGIPLLTAHMSKGLQFEVVFVIGLGEGTFPDYRAVDGSEYQMQQEVNNMYVAVTRAKRLCYLSYPEYKMMPWGASKYQEPSRFIKSILPEQ